ncbi:MULTISPECIES: acetyl-CoA carboxylase biotin carboxyl carrier protein [Bacillaceae]|uniref:Biotin carboxyl carrier protein of acetyl-CoA carboxylase n=1 Tax=Domibacillus aminovorans TaxID=29332 RepID=A0A177KS18_9BACI|nr:MULTISPECIES: acetyl-CoA carboxylase biotin carboxyl carrier protein [Bacillaceae]OAH55984.1 acetyl-CoA carboxylase biotin carboxyl carrier protein subunit [Domibacillus aminovorans]
MKVQEIRELIKLVDQSGIEEFVFESAGSKLKMKKSTGTTTYAAAQEAPIVKSVPVQEAPKSASVVQEAPAQEAPKSAVDESNLHKIISPMVGTFYQSPSPDADVYVKLGEKINAESVVCIVEAMKLFNEIEAEVDGEIVEILVKDGQLVEYGQPLFLVKPE